MTEPLEFDPQNNIIQLCPIPANMRIIAQFPGNITSSEPPFDVPVIAIAVYGDGSIGYITHSPDGILEEDNDVIFYRHDWESDRCNLTEE